MDKSQLGQHFLKNKEVLKKIIEASELKDNDVVFEIGAGNGVLTRELAKNVKKVIAVEIDESFKEELNRIDNVQVIIGDAIEKIEMLSFNKIVANIPYVIVEPLFWKLIKINFDSCVLLIGENFYNLLNNKESKWSVINRIFFDIEKVMDVKKEDFEPKPKVNSVLIKIRKNKNKLNKPDEFLREFLLQDDKKIKNALIYTLIRVKKITKKEAKEIIDKLGLSDEILEKYVNNLSNEDFIKVIDKNLII